MQLGIITGLRPRKVQTGYSGIKGGRGYSNEPTFGGYYNGAGAFMSYPESQLLLYWQNSKNGKIQSYDIRPEFKKRTNNRRITQNVIAAFLSVNQGKTIPLVWEDGILKPRSLNNLDWNF